MLAAFLTYWRPCVVFGPPAGWYGLVPKVVSDFQEYEQKYTKLFEAP